MRTNQIKLTLKTHETWFDLRIIEIDFVSSIFNFLISQSIEKLMYQGLCFLYLIITVLDELVYVDCYVYYADSIKVVHYN